MRKESGTDFIRKSYIPSALGESNGLVFAKLVRTLTGRVKGNENSVGSILKSSLEDEDGALEKGTLYFLGSSLNRSSEILRRYLNRECL